MTSSCVSRSPKYLRDCDYRVLEAMRAMAEGTRFGSKPKLTKHQGREALKRVAADEGSTGDA
jgi:hypothetical protein